eukprot:m.285010 g.285010  ORF g.285010 m.285010 type:complete len:182 (-) comp11276_c0_seq1:346-891(-)
MAPSLPIAALLPAVEDAAVSKAEDVEWMLTAVAAKTRILARQPGRPLGRALLQRNLLSAVRSAHARHLAAEDARRKMLRAPPAYLETQTASSSSTDGSDSDAEMASVSQTAVAQPKRDRAAAAATVQPVCARKRHCGAAAVAAIGRPAATTTAPPNPPAAPLASPFAWRHPLGAALPIPVW